MGLPIGLIVCSNISHIPSLGYINALQYCIHVMVLSLNFSPFSGIVILVSCTYRLYCSGLDSILLSVPPTVNDELVDLSGASRVLPFPSHVQCYWKTPKVLGYLMDLAIFVFLGLSGLSDLE